MRSVIHSLLALSALALAACPGAHTRKPDDLKVTRAVLYQNGIGYFERQGKVDGQSIKLRILPHQIADVLKSLTVVDLGSGRAINVALPVEKTQARRIATLPRQVRQGGGLIAIAQAFRGATAKVKAKGSSGTGRIIGVESLSEEGGQRLTILRDEGTLQSFDLSKVESLQIKDRTLEVGLRKALDVSLDEGSWKPVEMVVHLAGKAPHELLISYVVDMPTWKPAYRVVLAKDKDKGLLQGWAVVDNVSGEDWDGIELALTAGTPLTFTYDLYTPRFVRRPDLSPQQEELAEAPPPPTDGAAPAAEEKALASEGDADDESREEERNYDKRDSYKKGKRRARPPSPARRSSRTRGPGGKLGLLGSGRGGGGTGEATIGLGGLGGIGGKDQAPRLTSELMEKGFRALVAGTRIGSLFRYDIEEPVTIKDRQSALVSILNKRVPAEDVLLYRMDMAKQNPYRAVRLTNTTGYIIEKGPVAIYKDGSFMGEAVGGKVEANTSTFIPYSVDGRVLVSLEDRTTDGQARLLKIYNGQIVCEIKRVAIHKYTVYNRAGEAATMYVQRRHQTGWKLTQPTEGLLIEKDFYFVPVKIKAKGKTEVEVKEETPVKRYVAINSNYAKEAIALYLKDPGSDPKLGAALKEALELQDQVGQLDRDLARLRRAKETLSDRQSQVRDNLKLLGKSVRNADLSRKLIASLKQLETDLNKVTRDLVAQDMKRSELNDRLTVLIKSISLETKQ